MFVVVLQRAYICIIEKELQQMETLQTAWAAKNHFKARGSKP